MKLKLAIAGVGNCANALVQGLQKYRNVTEDDQPVPGLMHNTIGGYQIGDVEVVAAFDVNATKVGKSVGEAIWAHPNDTFQFAEVPNSYGPIVMSGPVGDGIGAYVADDITVTEQPPVDVAQVLAETEADVLVSYLPVGSDVAQKQYADAALKAGVAFVNAIPVFIASNPEYAERFTNAGVPIIGDDIKSQIGATITHRHLARLFNERGVNLNSTYQLNVGGNMDFKNMLERSRLASKKTSKTEAVTSNLTHNMSAKNVHVGPSDYVPFLTDQKHAFVQLSGTGFGDVPLRLEYKLEVWDSPNSAGVIIDAIRVAKLAKDRGHGGPIESASAYLMKHPPVQMDDDTARHMLEKYLNGGEK